MRCSSGHGQHGDYLFGCEWGARLAWNLLTPFRVTGEGDALQRGMDALGKNGCTNDVCSALKIQDGKDAIACTIPSRVDEDVGVKGNCKYCPKFDRKVGDLTCCQGLRQFRGML
jgi:hypothetical protein